MEADLLRLVLLVSGVILVAVIYLWDRYKRINWHAGQIHKKSTRRQPVFLEPGDAVDVPEMAAVEEEVEPEPLQLIEADTVLLDEDTPEALELNFSAVDSSDYMHVNPDIEEDLPRMVVQINLVTKGEDFSGVKILGAAREVGLEPGEMDIYHRYDANRKDRVLFSMASMVEPGQFPLQKMDGFSTPGLILFTQLPGVKDGVVIYSDMLFTAQRLLSMLGGVLQDETHSVLSKQTIEHTRESILEHRRKVQLARKR